MPQLKILSAARKRAFDDVPKLSKEERIGFLTPDRKTRQFVSTLRSKENKVGFLLQRAYFQAKGRFFNTQRYLTVDKKEAERFLGIKQPCDLSKYNAKTASHHKKLILESYQWKPYNNTERQALREHAKLQVDKRASSEDILFSLLDYCWANKTEIPSYREFADIVSESLNDYQQEILYQVQQCITDEQMFVLLSLIDHPDVAYKFSQIKRIDQGHNQTVLIKNAEILKLFRDTFLVIKPLLDALELTPDAIKEFSSWVYKSTITQIRQLKNTHLLCLHLAAFIQDQFYLRQDYAVDALLKVMRSTVNSARGFDRKQKEKVEQNLAEANRSVLHSAKSSQQILKLIIETAKNAGYSLAERNEKVIHLAESYFEAENPELVSHFQRMETNLAQIEYKLNFHEYLFASAATLQKTLGPLIRVLMFDEINSTPNLITAIQHYADNLTQVNSQTPTSFLSKKDLSLVLSDEDILIITKYKIMLFIYIDQAIRNRNLTLQYSYRYRTYRQDMIPDSSWVNRKSEFLKSARLDIYHDGKREINKLGAALTKSYDDVNDNYLKGNNPFLVVDSAGHWRLKNSKSDYDASKFIPSLLKNSKSITLYELLSEVDSYTPFSEAFSHSTDKHASKTKAKKLIYATLISLGTNLGHHQMSKAARNIPEKQLRDTELWWFSSENVLKANKRIVDLIQSLPLPTIFNGQEDTLHTSSDGKKVVVAVNSLLANYSYKYYGKEQGVSANSFLDEKQSFFHINVLTSSDREAPYMLDGLIKTKSSIFHDGDLDHKHSTDTHGYTEAIFAGLHFLNVSFAPRIARVNEQALYAYEAKSLRKNSSNPIAPKTQINKKLILDNWDDILRLMATIKLGYTSPSLLLRKLSSSTKDNALYRALKEFGRLIKSKFILEYINDESLRKSIEKQLNRVELGQKLSEAVFFGRDGKLQVGSAEEIQRVMACKTLLKNAIILWNYMYLSDYLCSLKNKSEKEYVIESIRNGSVIAWAHINMHGIYDFDHKKSRSFKATLRQMMNIKIDF